MVSAGSSNRVKAADVSRNFIPPMILKDNYRKKLVEKGLTLLESSKRCIFVKKKGIAGNFIPNWEGIPITKADENGEDINYDCPILTAWLIDDEYELICWEWTPGPGPGDFRIKYKDQESLIEFVESYFFGDNKYFEEKKAYHKENN